MVRFYFTSTNDPNHLSGDRSSFQPREKKRETDDLTLSVEGVQSLTSVRMALERSRRSLCFSSHAT